MRAVFLLIILFVLALVCAATRADDPVEPADVQVLCRDGEVAALRFTVDRPGLVTMWIPPRICAGRDA